MYLSLNKSRFSRLLRPDKLIFSWSSRVDERKCVEIIESFMLLLRAFANYIAYRHFDQDVLLTAANFEIAFEVLFFVLYAEML